MTATDRRFVFAALVVSIGWLLQGIDFSSAGYLVVIGGLLTVPRLEFTRGLRAREVWLILGASLLILGFLVGHKYLLPAPAIEIIERVRHHALYCVAWWLLTLFLFFRLWQMESKKPGGRNGGEQSRFKSNGKT
jgi:hypothetical protein